MTIIGDDPILPSPFLIGEAGAAIIAAIGYISSELWTLKNNRTQTIGVSVKDVIEILMLDEVIKVLHHESLETNKAQ